MVRWADFIGIQRRDLCGDIAIWRGLYRVYSLHCRMFILRITIKLLPKGGAAESG